MLEHKFKGRFYTQKQVLNIRFKVFWYTKINPTQIWYDEFLSLNNHELNKISACNINSF